MPHVTKRGWYLLHYYEKSKSDPLFVPLLYPHKALQVPCIGSSFYLSFSQPSPPHLRILELCLLLQSLILWCLRLALSSCRRRRCPKRVLRLARIGSGTGGGSWLLLLDKPGDVTRSLNLLLLLLALLGRRLAEQLAQDAGERIGWIRGASGVCRRRKRDGGTTEVGKLRRLALLMGEMYCWMRCESYPVLHILNHLFHVNDLLLGIFGLVGSERDQRHLLLSDS